MRKYLYILAFLYIVLPLNKAAAQPGAIQSFATAQKYSAEERPWVWWFWLGNIVTEELIDSHLETYAKAGYGGVNIIASYTVKGYEGREITYRSPEWYRMIRHTIQKARSLQMGVDLALSSAWPFGGPQIEAGNGAKMLKRIDTFQASATFSKRVFDKKNNEYAIAVSAFSEKGEYKDLTPLVTLSGILEATLPATGKWNIEVVIGGYTSQQVKRASPGGEGLVMDHFDKASVQQYLDDFNRDIPHMEGVRAFFNDSYEVYGADYTTTLLAEFKKRRGYSPDPYLSLLFQKEKNELTERFLCDYRATIADLIVENFLQTWTSWSHTHGVQTIQQAHGSPSNLLDMYAAAGIPQCESFGPSCFDIEHVRVDPDTRRDPYKWPDILHLKFASSAGNFMGRRLVASETATWLTNHFRAALSQVKPEVDKLFVSGINHIHLISTTNTPQDAPYPGWVFYPAPDFGPNAAVLPYMPDFSAYVSRVQNVLQHSRPDNDILLYYPVHDYFSEVKKDLGVLAMMDHIPTKWGDDWPFAVTARKMKHAGYQFDYVSDTMLRDITIENGEAVSKGGSRYGAVVIPACKRIPTETMQKLVELAAAGITIVFDSHTPGDVPGLHNLSARLQTLTQQREAITMYDNVSVTSAVDSALMLRGNIRKTSFPVHGLEYIRKSYGTGKVYFIANQQRTFSSGYVALDRQYKDMVTYDPLSGEMCKADIKQENNHTHVYLQLAPGQSVILLADCGYKAKKAYRSFSQKATELAATWNIRFEKNESGQPPVIRTDKLVSWTELMDTAQVYYQGTATYTAHFNRPGYIANSGTLRLQFSDVRDMAEVFINGKSVGRTWSVPYQVEFDAALLKKNNNKIEIKVTNLATNRIIGMDRHGVKWQECYIADPKRRYFNTADWDIVPSGLIGPVYLNRKE